MATSYALLLFCNLTFFAFLASITIGSSFVATDSELVERICNQTAPYYKFCKDVLNSDPRTPGADGATLAYVAFELANRNASSTQDQITLLLSNSTGLLHQHLEQCHLDYATAIVKTFLALTDLDQKTYGRLTYGRLTYFASMTGEQAKDCESAFDGTKSPLANNNNDLYGLSVICVALAKWLNV
ncbi:cell wall / vacuolar inhibitor of fructosidase 2-like [Rhodamnia argentea]|uniref:Cell wall / vacuolar inhibitor of fructosidase 2-like n=1 Tax=Rhodamnia argentea TaxID=178133 RepID=A0A8B8N4Q1_9MYRT|nr:cell wall / vacuolar inhibitor of fructosidase 2-like [Rhodamnia argentea]